MAKYDFGDEEFSQQPQADGNTAGGDSSAAAASSGSAGSGRDDIVSPVVSGGGQRGQRGKGLWLILLLVVLASGGGAWWYIATPHSAADQIAAADKYEKAFIAERPSLSEDQQAQRIDKIRQKWQEVFGKFPATEQQEIQALTRLSDFEKYMQLPAASRAWLEAIIDKYPASDAAKAAAGEIVDSLIAEAGELGRSESLALFEQAFTKCEQYCKTFEADPALVREFYARRCRIIDDKIIDPPIRIMRELEIFLDKYDSGLYVDEMLFRLARRHQQINELERAEQLFTRIIEEFPQSQYLRKAEFARAEAVSQLDAERGEKLWRELAEKYADDPELADRAKRQAEQMADAAAEAKKEKAAEKADEAMSSASRGRYGSGSGPGDMGYGKPIPPREMMSDFIEQKLDADHYTLTVDIAPDSHTINVSGTLTLINNGDDKQDFLLMLSGAMQITSMSFDSAAVKFSRPQGKDDVLWIELDSTWAAGATGELAFDMSSTIAPQPNRGKLPQEILDSLGRDCSERRVLVANSPTEAETAAVDSGEQEMSDLVPQTGSTSFMIQLNESGYCINGSQWYPVTMIGDLFTADITATLPKNLSVSFTGRQQYLRDEADAQQGQWITDNPVFALYFAYGPFARVSRTVGGVEVSVLLGDDVADLTQDYLDCVSDILEFYISKFGDYPFSRLDVIQVDLPPVLGGVGPAGMIFLHSSAVADMDHPPVNLIAHELSHHWWGNKIPINLIDGRYNQWLSEGFATYSDAMYTQHNLGQQEFEYRLLEMARLYLLAAESGLERPIMKSFMGQDRFYRHVVYEKGALVVNALRYVLGDEKFFELLKAYSQKFAYTPSTVDDFAALASEIAGEDLTWFFNEWLELPGCPIYEPPSWELTMTSGTAADGSPTQMGEITITLTQPDRLSQNPLDVFIHGSASDGTPQTHVVRVVPTNRTTTLTEHVNFDIDSVTLDDELRVLHLMSDFTGSWSGSRPAPAGGF